MIFVVVFQEYFQLSALSFYKGQYNFVNPKIELILAAN